MSGGGGHKRRGHEEEHEEHENHERWLVSYADMMTLLMVLFIVLFAISQVDSKKFAALKTGLSSGFGAPVTFLPGGDALLDPGGSVAPDSVNLAGSAGGAKNNRAQNDPQVDATKVSELAQAQEQAKVKSEVENLKKAEQQLKAALAKAGLPKKAQFRFNERGLVVTVATDNVLFPSASAQLQPEGRRILDALSPTLDKLPNNLSVEGHTNDIPIHTARYESNWELSGDRASGVLRYLHSSAAIPYDRMSFSGFGDTEPRLPDSDPASVNINRRVEIIVLARLDNSSGRAVEKLGNDATPAAKSTEKATEKATPETSESSTSH